MKIKNEYIKIKTKEKEISLRNMIFDKYLKCFFQRQYKNASLLYYDENISMNNCFIKFDEPITNIIESNTDEEKNSIITSQSFDISIKLSTTSVSGNEMSTSVIYNYSSKEGITIYANSEKNNLTLDDFTDKKITALGFGNNEVFACVDTSNYSISIIKGEELNISRKDIFTSDATCENGKYPIHLSPISNLYNYSDDNYAYLYSKLYSVGLAKTKNCIDEEYIIGENINIIEEDDLSFGFNLEKGVNNTIQPHEELYSSDDIYPIPLFVESEIYPEPIIYSSDDIYPGDSNYKYIIYRYRLCYISKENDIVYLDEYYNMSYPNNTKGLFEITTSLERT